MTDFDRPSDSETPEPSEGLVSGPVTEPETFEPVADTPISDLIGDLQRGHPPTDTRDALRSD
jgi:hypothetical protein